MKGIRQDLPLYLKLVVLTLLVTALGWGIMDRIHVHFLAEIFRERRLADLEEHTRRDRMQLEQVVKGFHQSLQLLVQQKGFLDYVERVADTEWLKGLPVHAQIHRHPPSWFPGNSVVRHALPTRHAILLDGENRVREIYQHQRQTPSALLPPSPLLLQLSQGDSTMTYLDEGSPYVMASQTIRRRSGRILATLIFATPMDEQFLASLQARRPSGGGILALFDGQENPQVLTSSDVSSVAVGAHLSSLRDRFFITHLEMFDYGSSELLIQFAALAWKKDVDYQVTGLLNRERLLHLLSMGVFVMLFLLVLAVVLRQLAGIERQVAEATTSLLPAQTATGHILERLASYLHQVVDMASATRREHGAVLDKMQEQEGLWRAVFQHVEEGILILDESGLVIDMNPAAQNLFGYSLAEMKGHSLRRLMPEHLWEKHRKALARYVTRDASHVVGGHIEVTALHALGHSLPLDLCVSELPLANGRRFVGVLRDLTEGRSLALAATLRDGERQFREVLEKVRLAAVILGHDGHITFCNDFFLETTGWRRQEVLGEIWWDRFLPGDHQEALRQLFQYTADAPMKGFSHHAFEAPVRTRQGQARLFHWYVTLLRNEDHRMVIQALVGQEITGNTRSGRPEHAQVAVGINP